MLPRPIQKFIEMFSSLPSIGPRQAHRLAFHIHALGDKKIKAIAAAVSGLSDIQTCEECYFTYEETGRDQPGHCFICANRDRDRTLIAIVEKETDLMSVEKTKKFNGRYLIIGDLKKDGFLTDQQKKRLNTLRGGKNKKPAKEIIVALNPTTYGDLNAEAVIREIGDFADKITRLGRGIPTGGEIEFADEATLGSALDHRG